MVFLDEILFLLTTAISVILLFSNFHLCGSLGESLFAFMHGMMGQAGYLFPFFFFGIMVFFISNRRNYIAMLKLMAVILVFWLACGVLQLFSSQMPHDTWDLLYYYERAEEGAVSGGVLGGILNALLRPNVGLWGMAVVLIVALIILMVLITGRSFFQPVKRGSSRLYSAAREDVSRTREYYDEYRAQARERKAQEREERENQKRMDRKIKGIMKDPVLRVGQDEAESLTAEAIQPEIVHGDIPARTSRAEPLADAAGYSTPPAHNHAPSEQEQPKETEKKDRQETVDIQHLNSARNISPIQVPFDQPETGEEEESADAEEDWLSHISGEIDRIFAQKDVRTLDELKAVEHAVPSAPEEVFDPWDNGAEIQPDQAENRPGYGGDDIFQDVFPEDVHEKEPQFSFKKSSPQYETRTITTASGKVIEAEVKAEDLSEDVPTPQGLKEGQAVRPGQNRTGQRMTGQNSSVQMSQTGIGQAGAAAAVPQPSRPPRPYQFPPFSLLTQPQGKGSRNRDQELKETAIKLQQTLKSFGVGVSVTNISCGPAVTRYEVSPEQGVKVSKIVSLTDDIKLNLAAEDIRIEAPIPGKAAVGIEVPNKEKVTVYFRELVESEEFRKHPSKLAFAVGKDLGGRIVVTNLASMPHLLIAGATGSGKSVCINTLIMSLIYKASPEDVRLIMVDPKVVELSVYNGIPHLLIPVVTDPKKAAGALNWAVAEMTDRYKKFAECTVRDLKSYNEKADRHELAPDGEPMKKLPQIVIIVDELADLMMVAPGEVEDAICRLAQLARAAGIHLVLATQRPSVNVITGLIKANMPSRIAFAVSSGVDSRTILDMNGAEKLLGKGDMLFSPSGYPKPVRLQGAFVSDQEVAAVVKFLSEHSDGPAYHSAVEMQLSGENGLGDHGTGGQSERDAYFVQAGRFVIEKEKASSGMLQRAFKIGFNRAARIIDQLSEAGVVGEDEGTKPRKVLMTMEEFEAYVAGQQNTI